MRTALNKKNLIKFKKRILRKLPHPTNQDNSSPLKVRAVMSNRSLSLMKTWLHRRMESIKKETRYKRAKRWPLAFCTRQTWQTSGTTSNLRATTPLITLSKNRSSLCLSEVASIISNKNWVSWQIPPLGCWKRKRSRWHLTKRPREATRSRLRSSSLTPRIYICNKTSFRLSRTRPRDRAIA